MSFSVKQTEPNTHYFCKWHIDRSTVAPQGPRPSKVYVRRIKGREKGKESVITR